jgi:hypothetical protein
MANRKIRITALICIGILITYYGLKLYQAPLETYTWTELLINYAAGFIRRGLIGKIAYWISPYISVKFFLSALITICYLVHLIIYTEITKKIDTFEWLMFCFSPAAFLFPVYDFDAFGRKDVFLILIFMLSFFLILKKVNLVLTLIFVVISYEIGVMIHEYTLFYFPFVIFLILTCYRKASSKLLILTVIIGVVFMIGNLIGLYAISRQYYNLDLIAESWIGLIKDYDLTPQSGAFGWMGVPLKEGLQPEFDKLSYSRTFFSYTMGMILALIPAILINARYQIIRRVKDEYRNSQWKIYGLGFILLCSAAVFIFSSDWGRLTYLFTFNIFLCLVVLKESFECETRVPETGLQTPYHQAVYILLILLYASTWYLKHYVDGDHIALQQGLIFQIFEWL